MILDRAHTLLRDDRTDVRINENASIPWRVKYKQREGVAKLRNISVSGMQVETDTSFNPKDECVLSFDSNPEEGVYIPRLGRLVWHRKKRFSRNKYVSGIKFMEADAKVLKKMRSRVQAGVDRFVKMRRMTTTIGFCLCAVIVGMIGALVWFSNGIYRDVTTANQTMLSVLGQQTVISRSYSSLYQDSKVNLAKTEEKLNIAGQLIEEDKAVIRLFSRELEATKGLLSETEAVLAQTNGQNVEINNELQILKAQVSAQQARIVDESVESIAGAQSLISTYRMKIKSVKNEIKRLKNVDRIAHSAVITQIDNQKSQIGNNGYVVKDGQTIHVDEGRYNDLKVNRPGAWQAKRNVSIDVTFF